MGANKLKPYTTSYCHFFRQQTKAMHWLQKKKKIKGEAEFTCRVAFVSRIISFQWTNRSANCRYGARTTSVSRSRCVVTGSKKKKIVCSALFFKNLNSNKPNTPRSFWETNFHYSPHRCLLQIATSNGHVWSGEIWRELYSNILLFTVDFLCWKEISEEIFFKNFPNRRNLHSLV